MAEASLGAPRPGTRVNADAKTQNPGSTTYRGGAVSCRAVTRILSGPLLASAGVLGTSSLTSARSRQPSHRRNHILATAVTVHFSNSVHITGRYNSLRSLSLRHEGPAFYSSKFAGQGVIGNFVTFFAAVQSALSKPARVSRSGRLWVRLPCL